MNCPSSKKEAGLARVTLLLVAIGTAGSDAIAQAPAVQYTPLKASDFPAQRLSLVGKYVELSGDFHSPIFIDNFMPGQFREDGRVVAEVVFDKIQPEARQWIVKNMCRMTCNGVFVRGQVVFRPNSPAPVLEMTDISIESKAGAQAGGSDVGAAIAAKDRLGAAKAVLPPHTIPTTSAWPDWTRVAPRSSGYDSTRSMRTNVETHADELNRAEYENERLIMRGPERPTDFQTSYRGIRDTGLWMLFQQFPFEPSGRTFWPRVAIIIEESPSLSGIGLRPMDLFRHGKPNTDYCWRLRAKVWTGPANSVDIAPFNWCASETRFNTPLAQASRWGATWQNIMITTGASTGDTRTTGPVPPSTPLPDQLQRKYTYTTIMVGSLLLDMGFDFAKSDGRVWFLAEQR